MFFSQTGSLLVSNASFSSVSLQQQVFSPSSHVVVNTDDLQAWVGSRGVEAVGLEAVQRSWFDKLPKEISDIAIDHVVVEERVVGHHVGWEDIHWVTELSESSWY